MVVIYVLEGNPRLTNIKFEGNTKYSDQKLLKTITSKYGEPFSEQKMFADSQAIEKMYEKAGYPATKVEYQFDNFDQAAGRSGVIFKITESVKIKIVSIEFNGAHAFPQGTLRSAIKTRRHWMFSWLTRGGVFKADQFEDDKDKLADYYRSRGYVDFEIQDIKMTHPTPKTLKIEFMVSEGKQYKVGSVAFKGTNMLFSAAEIIAGLKLKHELSHSKVKIGANGLEADVGLTFTPDALTHDIQSVSDFYGARGYIDSGQGGGLFLRATRIPNTEKGTMDLEYQHRRRREIVHRKN